MTGGVVQFKCHALTCPAEAVQVLCGCRLSQWGDDVARRIGQTVVRRPRQRGEQASPFPRSLYLRKFRPLLWLTVWSHAKFSTLLVLCRACKLLCCGALCDLLLPFHWPSYWLMEEHVKALWPDLCRPSIPWWPSLLQCGKDVRIASPVGLISQRALLEWLSTPLSVLDYDVLHNV